MGLMDIFADPKLFDTLTLGEKVIGSLVTALMGMGMTFAILVLIWGCIALIGRVVRKEEKVFHHEDAPAASSAMPEPQPLEVQDDVALIAVITAAIAAFEGSAVTSNLTVRKIRRVPGPDPVWSHAGRNEAVDNRRV